MKDKNKKHDLSKWTYAEIRDVINTSSGVYIAQLERSKFGMVNDRFVMTKRHYVTAERHDAKGTVH